MYLIAITTKSTLLNCQYLAYTTVDQEKNLNYTKKFYNHQENIRLQAIMVDHKTIRKETHNYVVLRPFTRVAGLPTWEQTQTFLKEFENIAMAIDISYDWAGDHGLLAELYGYQKYFTLTGIDMCPQIGPLLYIHL